jgi:hypothetical protein
MEKISEKERKGKERRRFYTLEDNCRSDLINGREIPLA